MKWLMQFTVRQDEVKQNRRLPEIAFFDTDGNPIDLSGAGGIATWAPSTDYKAGQVVVNSGHLYQAVNDHTSGATFAGDSAHWTALDPETDALALAQLATHAGLTTTAHGGIVSSADSRLTNARTPTAHKTSHATGGSDALAPSDIGAATAADLTADQAALATHAGLTTTAHGGIVASSDSRLTDARTPTAHKTSHATGGSDALAPSDIGAVPQSLVDAKGDLIVGTADNAVARKAVGTNGQILTSDSASAGGVKWSDTAPPTAHKASHGSGGSDPVTPADIGAIAQSLVDAKGDLIVGTADNTVANLPVGSDGKVLTTDSSQASGMAWTSPVAHADVQEFAAGAGQTWTKPAGATAVRVICVGAGGGGGGGASSVSTAKSGGCGGGGGAVTITDFHATDLGATEVVAVGAGGAGGTGGAAGAGADAANGGNGGMTTFGSKARAGGGGGGANGSVAASNTSGGGGSVINSGVLATAGVPSATNPISGQAGSGSSALPGNSEWGGAAGGGGGAGNIVGSAGGSSIWGGPGGGKAGGCSSANLVSNGGAGGNNQSYATGGGGTSGAAGGAGGSGAAGPNPYCGQGGGGGASASGSVGGVGGNGGRGAGGGGGGASCSATSSPAGAVGGNGGDGRCIVISW